MDNSNFEQIDNLKADVRVLYTKVDKLEVKVDKLETKVEKIDHDVNNLRIDVAEIKATMPHLATKAEVLSSSNRIIVWVIGTAFALGLFNWFGPSFDRVHAAAPGPTVAIANV